MGCGVSSGPKVEGAVLSVQGREDTQGGGEPGHVEETGAHAPQVGKLEEAPKEKEVREAACEEAVEEIVANDRESEEGVRVKTE
uniref:Uncharacterized protein n=1 Tax=Chromera velia CCMP2878 TaxID=1169474 RepID=A0A0G4I1S8_9ALVE|eukprot:Cvel_34807.t1-p1 / transcript=Cvel_34807.t1 / gene=Cvel_34807 / organism=Chromera_velia_CCMP2878 / gene_product=hypothetical protein / transcript_product=hypothetical protein / location=Cvel_scaffold6102:2657-2905(+) / protein_length=83 / sequence_SO=supercontig / SO=protein_coding / is_pseudo=false